MRSLSFSALLALGVIASGTLFSLFGCRAQSSEKHAAIAYHTCPMHPQILREGPGSCPHCKMDLVPVEGGDTSLPARKAGAERSSGAHGNVYACPMHPDVRMHEPGSCPHCGMDLEPGTEASPAERDASFQGSAGERPIVSLAPSVVRNLGVRLEAVTRRSASSTLRLNGRIVPEEGRVVSVPTRVTGYVEVLRASETGRAVRKGETLLEMYSPDVVATQERLLQILDRGKSEGETVERVRQRLLNWGIPASFIERVEKTGQVERRFPLLAPQSGVLLRKSVIEGQSAMAGMELFQIGDLRTVWVTARVWQSDMAWVRVGSAATITLPNLPGRTFHSKVIFMSPELDPRARSGEIRMRLSNTPGLDLRPEMLADVLLSESSASMAAISSQALIRSGGRNLAVVSLGQGRFQPREVTLGRESGGWAEILQGLEEGDSVVTSAQFLIDSESNLRAAVADMQMKSVRQDNGR